MLNTKSHPESEEVVVGTKSYIFENGIDELMFMPDNYVEILYNIGAPITRKLIGSIRSVVIGTGELALSTCRSKGMSLSSESLNFLCAKIRPEYTMLLYPKNIPLERDAVISLGMPRLENLVQFEEHLDRLLQDINDFEPSFMVEEAVRIIQSTNGEVKIKDINEQLSISKSFLEQRFAQEIGLSPKEFGKIEKMKHFLENYRQYQDSMTLTQLTFKSGYYDQSHLIKDFRYFMDSKPRDFIKAYHHIL
ncbi:MAG: helix-turn-helix domain-containing protein [Marinoscillum sp.]|uniref:helix-turn-helix domain-containing protein n=1 Tax=Marinoscillum sp. TaxID=2024838 RepID=UPI0033014273